MALDYKSSLGRYRRYLQMVQTQPLWSASMWVILSLILMIVLTWLALRPTLVTISGLMGKIRQQEEMSKKLDAKIAASRKAIEVMESIAPDLPLLNAMIPNTPRWEDLAEDLYKVATESGVRVISITINKIPLKESDVSTEKKDKTMVPTGIVPVKFSFSGAGDYQQLVDVVYKIQRMPRMVLISTASTGFEKTGELNLTVTGEAGYKPDKQI